MNSFIGSITQTAMTGGVTTNDLVFDRAVRRGNGRSSFNRLIGGRREDMSKFKVGKEEEMNDLQLKAEEFMELLRQMGYIKPVHCKDCMWFFEEDDLCNHPRTRDGDIMCLECYEDFYCAYGRKRENAKNVQAKV